MSALFLLPLFPVGVYLIIKGYTMIEEEMSQRYYERLVISRRLRYVSEAARLAHNKRNQDIEQPSQRKGWVS